MTAATADVPRGFTAPAALHLKKQFGERLAQTEILNTAKAAAGLPKAAAARVLAGIKSVLHALKLDAVGEAIGQAVMMVVRRIGSLAALVNRTLGWRLIVGYALTEPVGRDYVRRGVGATVNAIVAVESFLSRLFLKVPVVGKPLNFALHVAFAAVTVPPMWVSNKVLGFFEAYTDHLVMDIVRKGLQWALIKRVILWLVPPPFRFVVTVVAFVWFAFKPAKAAIEQVQNDPTVQRAAEDLKATMKDAADVVKGGVKDATETVVEDIPIVTVTTQPAVETMEFIVLRGDANTPKGKIVHLPVEVDSRGVKQVCWDGVYYTVDADLGAAEKDPIVLKAARQEAEAFAAAEAGRNRAEKRAAEQAARRNGSKAAAKAHGPRGK